MACLRIGSKTDALRRDGHTWVCCSSGLASDVTIQVGEITFLLHKFPLISKSGLLEKRIGESTTEDGLNTMVILDDIPGGDNAFELVSKFCYGIKFELNSSNVVSLRCAAEFLEMTEEYGEGNLIAQTEAFLSEVFSSWTDSMKALETCEQVLQQAEEIHVVSRCISSLAMKACSDPSLFDSSLVSGKSKNSSKEGKVWNGISSGDKPENLTENDWWYEDVSSLSLTLYKRFIKGVESKGIKPEKVSGSIIFFARKNIPLMRKLSSSHEVLPNPISSEDDQRHLLEELVALLPSQKGVTQTKFLLRLLKTAMSLQTSQICLENLEKRVGAQLDQASMVDLLIPNVGSSSETAYDTDCVQRIVDNYMQMQQGLGGSNSPGIVDEEGGRVVTTSQCIASMTLVAELVDSYLAEIAPDVNVKPPKFQSLAAAIPDYARPRYDGFYRAVDIYLKAHPWLTETEREQVCRLMNCQKLSLEASTHAAQNERLPLRVVVQVLFFEQLRLRTQISGWLFVSDNMDGSQNRTQTESSQDRAMVVVGDVKERVSDLEKECITMRKEIQRLARTKKRWSILSKMFVWPKLHKSPPNFMESKSSNPKVVKPSLVKKQEQSKRLAKNLQGVNPNK